MSKDEERAIETQIVLDRQITYQSLAENETDETSLKVIAAIGTLHNKIINDDLDSSEALVETLSEIAEAKETRDDTHENPIIDLRIDNNKYPEELTEEPVALRYSNTIAKKEADKDGSTSSIMQPIFDRVRSLDMPFLRSDGDHPKQDKSVSTVVESIISNKQENDKTDIPETIKKIIERQVKKLETEIKSKELIVKQAIIEKHKELTRGVESESERSKAPEANLLHSTPAFENIGKVLVKAESNRSKQRAESAAKEPIVKHIETISRSDLLELSAKTVVDGTTLRKVYETSLITEKGLRRVMTEYLRGGDIKSALKRELVEHEKDFERDPILRDKTHQTRTGGVVLDKLIMKIDSDPVDQSNKLQQIMSTQLNINPNSLSKKKVRVSWIDIVMLIFISVLLTMVLTLVMGRQ